MVIHSMVKSLLTALKLKDPITYDHCLRVAKERLSIQMNIPLLKSTPI